MPIICKIQLDASGYKTELDNVLKLTVFKKMICIQKKSFG